jgi:DNA-binding transcriptional LysR family regulator
MYLRGRRKPRTVDDLQQHECLPFVQPNTGQTVPWLVRQEGRIVELPVTGKLRCSDDILGPVTLARAGAGVLQSYRFLVEEDLREGRLVELLPGWAGASRPFSLLYPADSHKPLRVRVLIDYLVAHLSTP